MISKLKTAAEHKENMIKILRDRGFNGEISDGSDLDKVLEEVAQDLFKTTEQIKKYLDESRCKQFSRMK